MSVHIFDREIEFVFVMLGIATILRAAVGQHPIERDAVLLEERQTRRSFKISAAVIGVLRSYQTCNLMCPIASNRSACQVHARVRGRRLETIGSIKP